MNRDLQPMPERDSPAHDLFAGFAWTPAQIATYAGTAITSEPAPPPELRIVRLLSVRDTRHYEEVRDDVWKPIPGSGTVAQCARCGRDHEVHATVELSDGAYAIVGTGCAAQGSMEPSVAKFESADRAARRIAQLEAQLASVRKEMDAWRAERARIDSLALPEVRHEPYSSGAGLMVARMEGSQVWYREAEGGFTAERRQCLIDSWKHAAMRSAGFTRDLALLRSREDSVETALGRVRRRLDQLLGQGVSRAAEGDYTSR
jgi:hypothetical protein